MNIWRHIKRGTTYRQIGQASLQCTEGCEEGAVLVVYQGDDGKLWARPHDEFYDGRFERAADAIGPPSSIPADLIERAREIANRHWNSYGEQEHMWQDAHDLAIAIAALNSEKGRCDEQGKDRV